MTRAASVQFTEPLLFRVIRVHEWPTYDGWVWLDGYQLNASGDAVERRSIFVQVSGLQHDNGGSWSRVGINPAAHAAANVGRSTDTPKVRTRPLR